MSEEVVPEFRNALHQDDTAKLAALLLAHPELIEQPVFSFDCPAIVEAASRSKRKVIDVLLDAGADINARSQWWAGGFGVLDLAEPELAEYLMQRGAVLDANAASRLGRLDRLKELVEQAPTVVHARGGDGQTPLHVASTVEIAAYLLEHGARIDALDIDHESTPAMYLVEKHPEVTRYLMSRGCQTDILMAAAVGDIELVRRFLDARPESVRTSVNREYFPMRNPHAGGTIYTWTLGGNLSAHQVAKKFGHPEVVQLLMERSPVEWKLTNACAMEDRAAVESLRAKYPDAAGNLSHSERAAILHVAQANRGEAVRLMLECGWPTGGEPETPLHWASFHGNVEMARAILKFHPPLEALDLRYQAPPLGWACHGSQFGWYKQTGDYAGVAEVLLEAGAKPPERISGSPAVREVLRKYGVPE
jgi:ankyrin repeat protein